MVGPRGGRSSMLLRNSDLIVDDGETSTLTVRTWHCFDVTDDVSMLLFESIDDCSPILLLHCLHCVWSFTSCLVNQETARHGKQGWKLPAPSDLPR